MGNASRYNRRMRIPYHRDITARALESAVSPQALQAITAANIAQDGLRYQLGHDHFHFDSSQFKAGYAYIESQRDLVRESLKRTDTDSAWRAFGRLTHSAQDFYAHSNYLPLWLDLFAGATPPPPPEVDPLSPQILQRPDLRSGKLYYPFEALTFLPYIGKLFVPLMPADSHAKMNHDGPEESPLFDYIFHAAVKRTALELEKTLSLLPPGSQTRFADK